MRVLSGGASLMVLFRPVSYYCRVERIGATELSGLTSASNGPVRQAGSEAKKRTELPPVGASLPISGRLQGSWGPRRSAIVTGDIVSSTIGHCGASVQGRPRRWAQ